MLSKGQRAPKHFNSLLRKGPSNEKKIIGYGKLQAAVDLGKRNFQKIRKNQFDFKEITEFGTYTINES